MCVFNPPFLLLFTFERISKYLDTRGVNWSNVRCCQALADIANKYVSLNGYCLCFRCRLTSGDTFPMNLAISKAHFSPLERCLAGSLDLSFGFSYFVASERMMTMTGSYSQMPRLIAGYLAVAIDDHRTVLCYIERWLTFAK